MISGANHYRFFIHAQTRMIGHELVTTTNSTHCLELRRAYHSHHQERSQVFGMFSGLR